MPVRNPAKPFGAARGNLSRNKSSVAWAYSPHLSYLAVLSPEMPATAVPDANDWISWCPREDSNLHDLAITSS